MIIIGFFIITLLVLILLAVMQLLHNEKTNSESKREHRYNPDAYPQPDYGDDD